MNKRSINDLICKVLEGDVLEKLSYFPDESIDLIITSPPYNKRNKNRGWLVTNEKYSHSDDKMNEDDYQEWQVQILNELYRIVKPGGSLFYNHKLRFEDGVTIHPISWLLKCVWPLRQEIIWDRGLAANMRGWRFWSVDERIYWLYKPISKNAIGQELLSKDAKMSSIWRLTPAPRSEDHPAAFPLALPIRIIYSMPHDESMIVLDPFCGTGTTLVAAKLLGHRYIGIDHSPVYIQDCIERLECAESERRVMEDEISKHFIDDPFVNRKERGTVSWPFGPKPVKQAESSEEE